MNTNKVFPSMNRGVIGQTAAVDFNQIVTPGVYYFIRGNYTHSNTPPESTGGILRVYGGSSYSVQEYSNYGRTSYSRIKWGETWYDWQRIDNFGYNTLANLATALKPLLGLS